MEIKYVDITNEDLRMLVTKLDDYFFERWGEIALAYRKHHDLSKMACAIVGYEDVEPVVCGCWKPIDSVTAEIKRIYTEPSARRKGYAAQVVSELEKNAAKAGSHKMVLETGRDDTEAIAFYERMGYRRTEGFGDFAGDCICMCLEKEISDGTMR